MHLVDLTLEIGDGFESHAAHPRTILMNYVTHSASAPRYKAPCQGWASKLLILSDHIGTHVDAPYHFCQELGTMESILPEQLVGSAVAIDVSFKEIGDGVDQEMLEKACEDQSVQVRQGDVVLLRCWSEKWGSGRFHEGRCLTISGAKWLVDKGVKAVGTDLGSIDDTHDATRPVHPYLIRNNVLIMENVINIDQIKSTRFFFIGLPLKIKGATGSPIRAVAITDWNFENSPL